MKTTQETIREKIGIRQRIVAEISHLCMSVSACENCMACGGMLIGQRQADLDREKEFKKQLAQLGNSE